MSDQRASSLTCNTLALLKSELCGIEVLNTMRKNVRSYVSIRLEASGGRHLSTRGKYIHNKAKKMGPAIKALSVSKSVRAALRFAQESTYISE